MVSAGSITVAVRVRPPSAWEASRLPEPCFDIGMRGDGALSTPGKPVTSATGLREVVKIVDDRILMFDPNEKDTTRAFVERGFLPPGTKRYKDKRFMFDHVFDSDARQVDVYESTARPLLDRLLDGYNATVFAYGATGCGKTHTISGAENDPGIIYLTMAELFQRIEDKKADYNIEINVTFLEIYNEEIRDLLAESGLHIPRGGLQIREDKSVKVVGLVELHPTSAEQIKEIVILGNTRRTQSPTHANETSSRSHAVLQVNVTQSPRTASTTEQRTMATLSIIDLAGSERAAATSNMGQRMVEGANINKSLLALGNCINALCESGGGTRHVPYRNSKLTRLLKFSLGGNCKTVMIVCIAPASNHYDDTHNTLLYADRASKIKTKVVTRNVVNVDRHVGQYVEAINRLNIEVAELKAKLAGKLKAEVDVWQRKKDEAKLEVERAKDDIQRKAEQTQPLIIEGASCHGRMVFAQVKLRAIRLRLTQLQEQSYSNGGNLPSDLAAEENLLQTMASPEEAIVKPDSDINRRLHRSSNANNMFDAMLRAVSERRSDRLDELSIGNIRLDVQCKKAEMERLKAETERDILKDIVISQAEVTTQTLGMLARCIAVMEEGSGVLRSTLDAGKDDLETTARNLSMSLRKVADSTNLFFTNLISQSIVLFPSGSPSALLSFSGYSTTMTSSLIHVNSHTLPTQIEDRRRTSSATAGVGSPARRAHRNSPRKSLRSSITPGALQTGLRRAVSGKATDKRKNVQWRDHAGQGAIDDGGMVPTENQSGPSSQRNTSIGGSESEWEDEKPEDSPIFMSLPARDIPLKVTNKRPRASRLDPVFLKFKGPMLTSLAEDDETKATDVVRRSSPFSDRVNILPTPADGSSSMLDIRKPHGSDGSPIRRGSSVVRVPGSVSKSGRRRSNIGPVRSDKVRRRSSLLPRPSPTDSDDQIKGGARRVPVNQTTAKRPKRTSLLGDPRSSRALRSSVLRTSTSVILDPNGSGDLSFRGSKPTWR